MTKWEYKVIQFHATDDFLNELGYEGWELITSANEETPVGEVLHFYFKRPLLPAPTQEEKEEPK